MNRHYLVPKLKPEIRPVASSAEFAEVCRFRYQIYVEEMQRKQRYADHNKRIIEDPLDLTA